MEMGVNNPDVKRVIQCRTPQGRVPSLHQRGDQAAQSKLVQQGYLIWCIPERNSWRYHEAIVGEKPRAGQGLKEAAET